MATSAELELLRTYALEEQFTAAVQGRSPDIHMLDELAKLVLPDFSAVLCNAPVAYSRHFDETRPLGYAYEKVEDAQPVVGRFGGFLSGVVETVDEDELLEPYKVGFFVLTGKYVDTGYVCPVEDSTLVDALEQLKDNQTYIDLAYEFGQEQIDMQEVVRIISRLKRGDPNIKYLNAYLGTILSPHDLYMFVEARDYYLPRISFDYIDANMTDTFGKHIDKNDTFAVISLPHDPSGLPITPTSPELVIKRPGDAQIMVPVALIEGYVCTDLLKIPEVPEFRKRDDALQVESVQ